MNTKLEAGQQSSYDKGKIDLTGLGFLVKTSS